MSELATYNNSDNLVLAHKRLDELDAKAVNDRMWGWVRIGIRYRDGKRQQVSREYEGIDAPLDENSDNVD